MIPLDKVTLVYENGYTQPLADVVEVGTLIDPDDGDDLAIIGVEVSA